MLKDKKLRSWASLIDEGNRVINQERWNSLLEKNIKLFVKWLEKEKRDYEGADIFDKFIIEYERFPRKINGKYIWLSADFNWKWQKIGPEYLPDEVFQKLDRVTNITRWDSLFESYYFLMIAIKHSSFKWEKEYREHQVI